MVDVLEGTLSEKLRLHPYTLKDLAGSDIVLTRETKSVGAYHYGGVRQNVEKLKPLFDKDLPVGTIIEISVSPTETRYFEVVTKIGKVEKNSIYVQPTEKPENLEKLKGEILVTKPSLLQSLGEH